MNKNNFEFEVLVNGKPVKEYIHDGKLFIEGKKETQYSLRVKNNSFSRILVIPTVDGLNVLTGKPASSNDRGYVINAYSSATIDGWRMSDKEVAKFFFSNPDKAYSSKKGQGQNVGVIGCAIIKEKIHYNLLNAFEDIKNNSQIVPWRWWDNDKITWTANNKDNSYRGHGQVCFNTSSNNTSFYMSSVSRQEIGTGFGEKKHSEVVNVDFDREENPTEIFAIYYNTREQLQKMGIQFIVLQYVTPNPFPKDQNEYCTPPDKE